MASASSSSGSGPNGPRTYDVFISFRGEDTRNNFTSHLHDALNRASLQVFCEDKKLEKGDEISPSLTQAIKDSSVSVIVLSEDYASSEWCLDELDQIMQFRKEEIQFVIPIFYKVDPKDVRNQTGVYKEAFGKHETNYQHEPDKVNRWRAALSEAGQLSGWGCQTSVDESNLIEVIVADVCTKLERIHNCHGTLKDVIGIDEMVKTIEELLKKSHKVGIWGMGGVGKTTMANVVFDNLSSQYNHRCFLENVREETEKKGLKHVRDSLVSKLLGEDKQIDLSDEASVFRRLSRTKAFVVLDDVNTTEQLENLQDNTCNFLGEGSKVIITTRDQKLLRGKGYEIHEAKGLSDKNSRRLFIRKAFGSDNAKDGYEELIEGFVNYTKHNPLALKVLGSLVFPEHKEYWGDLLRKLRAGEPNDEIQKVLSLSYDRLNHEEKQIFLDIACFLKGESEEFVKELMESCGFHPTVGMQILKDKALIDTTSRRVEMHDLIQEMGRQIVREENIKEPGKRSRLWDSSEISNVLGKCEGGEEVEGIILLDRHAIEASELTAKLFNKMTKLRFLKIHSHWEHDMSATAKGLESISTQIRYFHWECYPMKSLPSNFSAKHLLELNLNDSWVETLWEGVQDLVNLRRLNLQWCLNLRELPDFSKACRLESVVLSGCERVSYVHASLLSLNSLISLGVSDCISLESLQSTIHLKSLKEINIDGCRNIKEFSVSSEELTSLDLSGTMIEELSLSIGLCSKLRTLDLGYTRLKNLPVKVLSCLTFLKELRISLLKIDNVNLRVLFDRLRSLQVLVLRKCRNLTELPDNITQLSSLEELYLEEWPRLTKLPDNMKHLSKLQVLSVEGCTALHSLPELPPSLGTNCISLETVSRSMISSTPQHYGEKFFPKDEPSDVRNQIGAYKETFEKHEKNYEHDPDRVNRWRAALSEASKLSGTHNQTSSDESTLSQEIVTDVSTKLECIYNCRGTLKDVIGIDEMIEPIEKLLEESHKVGIWGMGGVGKTTMAKAVFAKLSYRYDNCCFLENAREKTEKNGSEHVRNSLISKLLGQDMQNDPSNASRNNAYVVRRLGTKKVLVVLDDVDSLKLLEYLQENICNFLAEGSKVIITTRDMQLLRANNYEIHEAKGLSFENSLQLFVSKAFRSEHPKDGYEELINGFVHYTQHNPLALKVLGSLVRSVHKEVWDDLLRKLMAGNPNDKIQKVLELSYNGLDHKEQQLFLDIACFLKGESEEFVEELLESYDFYPTNGMQTLKDKALIVTTDGKVDMHDLIQEMGHQIVHKESIKEPGKRSRLWDTGEIFDVFENCEGGQNVEGIILLDRYATGASYLTAKTFNKMMRLRFLKIHSPWDYDMSTTATGLESISTQIRYFHWECYPMKSLPSNFCAEHLLELNLNRSWVETLWEGVQDLAKLRRLKLQWCRNLRELPDFSKACRLESVDLRGCESLCYVHASLLSLDSLISLDVGHCWSLESLQSRIQLISLKEIIIDMCYNLKEFSVSSKELTSLDLSGTMIEELSLSIGLCSKLTTLYLPDKKLKNLPIKVLSGLTSLKELRISLLEIDNVDLRVLFDRLRSLQSLSLRKCRNLTELPDNITQLSCLEKLHLAKCPNLTKLPVNMRLLAKLQHLSVKGCTALHSLPELPPSLRKLYATNCTSLETVSPSTISSTTQNKGEKVFSFKNCLKLDLGAIEEQVKLLLEKAIHENEDVEVYFPGKKVPEWFGNNQTQNDSDTLKLCLSSHTSVGFIFCAVAPDFLKEELSGYLHIAFCVDEDEMTKEVVEFPELTYFTDGNVLVRSYPKASESIREKIEGKRRNHDATTYNPNLFFKFSFTSGFCSKPIEECGVFPLYTSGNSELNSNSRKRKAVMI